MAPIETFVFMDFGTAYGNADDVTGVSLMAIPRLIFLDLHLKEPTYQRTVRFDKYGSNFGKYKKIEEFINRQPKPVCLVAHNGHRFDFIILKRELQKLDISLPDDILCADSLYAFYDILEFPDNVNMIYTGAAVRDKFFEGNQTPNIFYTLEEVYNQEVKTPYVKPHPTENDNIMNFRISRKLAKQFLAWTDQIQFQFTNVKINFD